MTKVLDKTVPAPNYLELRGKGPFKGQGWTVPASVVLIFPAARQAADPWMTPHRIDEAAARLFDTWGGVARAQACISAYKH